MNEEIKENVEENIEENIKIVDEPKEETAVIIPENNQKSEILKKYEKDKEDIYDKERETHKNISEIKGALVQAIKHSMNAILAEMEVTTDYKKLAELMAQLKEVTASKDLSELQKVCNGNIENINNIVNDDVDSLTIKAKGKGMLSKLFPGRE